MEDRFEGEIEPCGVMFSQTGELGSRPCQKTLGELALFDGDDLIGDVSALEKLFYRMSVKHETQPCLHSYVLWESLENCGVKP